MMTFHRYSPIQLVLGINPNLPSISLNKLPAMEDIEVSDILRKNLNTLHAARHAYVKSESDERIRRALRHPVRTAEVEFNQGDKVFYKRDYSNRWRGQGSIIGVDGKVAFIKHGSRSVRVPKCRLVLVNPDTEGRNMKLSNAQDNILKDNNSDHQRHESLMTQKIHLTRILHLNLKINATCRFLMTKNTLHKNQESKVKAKDRIWIRENDQGT